MRAATRVRHALLILWAMSPLPWCQIALEVRAQPPQTSPVARELAAHEAAAVLNLPRAYLEMLRTGVGGFEAAGAPKNKLSR